MTSGFMPITSPYEFEPKGMSRGLAAAASARSDDGANEIEDCAARARELAQRHPQCARLVPKGCGDASNRDDFRGFGRCLAATEPDVSALSLLPHGKVT